MSNITIGKYIPSKEDFVLYAEDRTKHLYIIGKSGTGKSTLLKNIFLQDIYQLGGVCLIDPHGDLAEEILQEIPKQRLNDVLYLNLADIEHPVLWNPLQKTAYLNEYQIAQALTLSLKHIWADSWGVRMEYILFNALYVLSASNSTLTMLTKFLHNLKYRQSLLKHVKDPKILYFWEVEYLQIIKEFPEALMPIENKVGIILSLDTLRNLFSSRKSSFDLRFAMDNQKIIIVNLAKGKIGKETANLFGSIFVSILGEVAMTRQDLPKDKRVFFSLIIDEFQSFTTESFISILSEIRKYAVGLTLSHQYIDQLSEKIKNAVMGNVGNKVLFSISPNDAENFEKELDNYRPSAIYNLANHNAFFIRDNGYVTQIKMSEPHSPRDENIKIAKADFIISENRKKFAGIKNIIESKITKFFKNISKTGKSGYSYFK